MLAQVVNNAGLRDYSVSMSGKITSDSTSNSDHIEVKVVQGQSGVFQDFTGGDKKYAAGRSGGQITSDVGFTLTVFGRFPPGEEIKLQVSKDFVGQLVVEDLIITLSPITPGII